MEEIFMIIQLKVIEKYRELKKVMIGKGEDHTTGTLLDFNYFDKHYKLVAVDLSKQKELDADPRAIQQIEFKYIFFFFFNWYSLHARLNSHYEAWSYKKRKHK